MSARNALPEQKDIRNELARNIVTGSIIKKNNKNNEELTNGQKWWISILLGLLFMILSSSLAYDITSYISKSLRGPNLHLGEFTLFGLLIHSLIFTLIVRLILW